MINTRHSVSVTCKVYLYLLAHRHATRAESFNGWPMYFSFKSVLYTQMLCVVMCFCMVASNLVWITQTRNTNMFDSILKCEVCVLMYMLMYGPVIADDNATSS